MEIEWVRRHCLSFPHATEQVQWGNDLVFKVAGKLFAVAPLLPTAHDGHQTPSALLHPPPVYLCFKCTPEMFRELTERPGVKPAPYMARAYWIALEHEHALPMQETKALLRQSYELVFEKLPKKVKAELEKKIR
jgi:predicted DNA-binding protein (MmcQ/YjbR family)